MRRLVQDSKNADPYKLEETDLEDCASFCSSLENWNVVKTLIVVCTSLINVIQYNLFYFE